MPRVGKNIYRRKDGRYEGRYISGRDESGKAKYSYIYGKTSHEVEARLAEIKTDLKAEAMKGKTSFAEAAGEWLEDRRKNISEASVDRYEYLLDKYITPEFGGKDIASVNMVQLNAYINELADREKLGDSAITGSTIESLQSVCSSVIIFANKAELDKLVLRNRARPEKNHYKPLNGDEIKKLISCAKYNMSPDMLGVLLSLYAGLGTGEICALSWDDFDLDRREISVSHTLYRVKMKDGDGTYGNRTRLTVTNVRKSAVRVVQYPKELDSYVREYYHKGCVFLTGEKERYKEQRTFCNHLEAAFRNYGLEGLTMARVKKTYEEGLASVRYLTDPFYKSSNGSKQQLGMKVDERWLIKEMENDLSALRSILGISSRDMAHMMGISEENYVAVEAGEQSMEWNVFLSLLFLFKYNSKTEGVVDALGLYPEALKDRMAIVV